MAVSKRKGIKSSAQDNFLAPTAPTINSVTDIGTGRAYNDGAVDVAFTYNGQNPATSYSVLSSGAHVATGSSSPIRITGLSSDTAYTFQVKAINAAGESAYSTASSSVTVTTVPAKPAAPTASTVANTAQDSVSWTAPANGGKAISGYTWASSDGKSGSTASTSVTVNQEAGTAQTYTVYATNANGNSVTSDASASVTTFSFVPFSVFGFVPFGVFGFSPFGVFGFSPFGVFGFSPFGVFGFSPGFNFAPWG